MKKENIHIALDTAGVGNGDYKEILKYVDLVILDIKHIDEDGYYDITGHKTMNEVNVFIKQMNESDKEVWLRQVIIPGVNDNHDCLDKLALYIKSNIKNVKRVEFLPYHRLGREKYLEMGIPYPYEDKKDMNKDKCEELYNYFQKKYTS